MKVKTFLLLMLLCAVGLTTGCPYVNNTGLGSCYLGDSGPSGTGCIGSPSDPSVYYQTGGFSIYTFFRLVDYGEDTRADLVYGIWGQAQTALGGANYGYNTNFPSTISGAVTIPPPQTVPTDTRAGFVDCAQCVVPAQWYLNWGGVSQNSQWGGYLQTHLGPFKDADNNFWPNWCLQTAVYENVEPGDTIPMRCRLYTCNCQIAPGTPPLETAHNYATPSTEMAGNLVDMTVKPTIIPSGGFYAPWLGIEIYDGAGTNVACFGFNGACSALTVTGPGNTEFIIPAWGLGYADNNRPGDYWVQIQYWNGTVWANTDSFGFSIINGGVPVYRYYSPSHGTHYFNVAQNAGSIWPYDYRSEGIGFYIYEHGVGFQPTGNSLSMYMLSCCQGGGNGAWLLTDNATEQQNAVNAGWIPVGLLGNIMPYQYQNCDVNPCYTPDIPLYRTWIPTNGNANFMFTTNYSEYVWMLQHGFNNQGISGYLPSAP